MSTITVRNEKSWWLPSCVWISRHKIMWNNNKFWGQNAAKILQPKFIQNSVFIYRFLNIWRKKRAKIQTQRGSYQLYSFLNVVKLYGVYLNFYFVLKITNSLGYSTLTLTCLLQAYERAKKNIERAHFSWSVRAQVDTLTLFIRSKFWRQFIYQNRC